VVLKAANLWITQTGTLSVKVTSAGRRVVLDGIIVRNAPASQPSATSTASVAAAQAATKEVHAIVQR
jgi:hypothetical protein